MEQNESQNKENIDVGLTSIKSMFETGEIIKMYQLAKLHPTKIITALGLNHGRYIEKLSKPEKFSIGEVIRFALLTGADYNKVLQVIMKQAIPNIIEQEDAKRKDKSLKTSGVIETHKTIDVSEAVLPKAKKARSRKSK